MIEHGNINAVNHLLFPNDFLDLELSRLPYFKISTLLWLFRKLGRPGSYYQNLSAVTKRPYLSSIPLYLRGAAALVADTP
jgi:hypothetical protein